MSRPFDYKLFDLEPRDLLVYEALLESTQTTSIRKLADKTNMNRGTTFEIIKKLQQKGLVVSHFRNKRKYYAAQNPEELKKYAKHTQETVDNEITLVETYVQALKRKHVIEKETYFSQFYEGDEEIAALLRDVLYVVSRTDEKMYRVISSAEIRNHLYRKFRNFTRQRIKQGVFAKVIGVGAGGEEAALAERRWLTSDQSPACYIIIYGDKVAQISLAESGEVQGSVVQNRGVAELQRLMFDKLWQSLA